MGGLFETESPSHVAPLAARARPNRLSDMVGHAELLDDNGVICGVLATKRPITLVLSGPPGVGKTTLARLLAKEIDAEFVELTAVSSGVKDLKDLTETASRRNRMGQARTVCFVDELHRFSRTQQDALLRPLEEGVFSFIGATTENPYVTLSPALLSRVKVVRMGALGKGDLKRLLERGAVFEDVEVSDHVCELLAKVANGDGRLALSALEDAATRARARQGAQSSEAYELLDRPLMSGADQIRLEPSDVVGEEGRGPGLDVSSHFELSSALIKSMRASDADGALRYLAQLIVIGEDPLFIARRLAIFASEDVGLADPMALVLAEAIYATLSRIGMPEGRIVLGHGVLYMSKANKSRDVIDAIDEAIIQSRNATASAVPEALRGTISHIEARYRHLS